MAEEESDKPEGGIDALRAALIAQGKEEPPPIPDQPFALTDGDHYEASIPPREALERLGLSASTAIAQMHRELEHGRVEAIAQEAIWGDLNTKRAKYALVPAWVWVRVQMAPQDDFWETGYLYSSFPSRAYDIDASRSISFFGIRFWPNNLPAARPQQEEGPQSAQAASGVQTASKGGRPAKPWWDELWAEIGAQLYNGGLKPSRLADIEKAMHEWVAQRGDTIGETPIRRAAKLLWDAIQRED